MAWEVRAAQVGDGKHGTNPPGVSVHLQGYSLHHTLGSLTL